MRRYRTAVVLVPLAAALFAVLCPLPRPGIGIPANDVYGFFYVHRLYLVRVLRDGGRGLLWNRFQNCGQPFFGNPLSSTLYPPNLLFLILPADAALRAVVIVNLMIGGVGLYALARELGTGVAAALGGALAFELGNASLALARWTPDVGAPYAWFPIVMWGCERLLRAPTPRRGVALGVALTCAFLPGFPLLPLLMLATVGLRTAVQLPAGPRRGAIVLALVVAVVVVPLLGAVQFLPAVELGQLAIRGKVPYLNPSRILSLETFARALERRTAIDNPVVLAPAMLAAAAFLGRRRWVALFYAGAGALFAALSAGLWYDDYSQLSASSVVYAPARFLWATDFCLAVLTALGIDALLERDRSLAGRAARVIMPPAILALLAAATPGGLVRNEWVVALTVLALCATTLLRATPAWAGVGLAAAIALNAVAAPSGYLQEWLPSGAPLRANARAFAALATQLTPQYRTAIVHGGRAATSFGLMEKTSTVLGVPGLDDYDPLPTRRYAAYFAMMRAQWTLENPAQMALLAGNWGFGRLNRRLFDLTAARYLVVDPPLAGVVESLERPPVRISAGNETVRIYENPDALPRARFVPRLEIVPDPDALLRRLADGNDDLRTVAFIETSMPSTFIGDAADAPQARVDILRDDPEHVVLQVHTPQHGFVLLADQDYPGWRATVNGHPTVIRRADYVFRLVEVPAGVSTVEFRFRPPTVIAGALVSGLTIFGLAGALRRRRSRAAGVDSRAVAA